MHLFVAEDLNPKPSSDSVDPEEIRTSLALAAFLRASSSSFLLGSCLRDKATDLGFEESKICVLIRKSGHQGRSLFPGFF